MKKTMAVLTVLMCFASTSVFAQEVRGIETRRVEYIGTLYWNDGDVRYSNTTMYGFEFHNANSIKVSVDIELLCTCYETESVVATKSIVLNPNETYVFKQESRAAFCKRHVPSNCDDYISSYYVKYKAFKLQ